MIFGVGADIVRVARIQRNLDRYRERFARRILNAEELQAFQSSRQPAYDLAKRFAAKEAAAKALGTGFSQGIGLRQIGVFREPGQRPQLRFYGPALDFIRDHGIAGVHLSLADERDHAVAVVVLETE